MTNDTILEPLPEDQWFIESPELRSRFALPQASLVATVRKITEGAIGVSTQTLAILEPYFQELLAQQQWLPSFRCGYSNAPCKEEDKEYAQLR
ncbi:MAG: hypothetical protein V7K47_04930 [Nostoc sp.]